jgi:hypothetical protein
MIDWGWVLDAAIRGTPAAAFTLLVVWAVWLVVRLFKRIAGLFRRRQQPDQVRAPSPRTPVRIEPVIEAAENQAVAGVQDAAVQELKASIVALNLRVNALERQLSSSSTSYGQVKRTLRVIQGEEGVPRDNAISPA